MAFGALINEGLVRLVAQGALYLAQMVHVGVRFHVASLLCQLTVGAVASEAVFFCEIGLGQRRWIVSCDVVYSFLHVLPHLHYSGLSRFDVAVITSNALDCVPVI